jgi:hypothetical protein
MQFKKIILSGIFLISFLLGTAYAQNLAITSVDGGLLNDYPITIAGRGFGLNTGVIEWLGGISGNIEQGVVGNAFNKQNWAITQESSGFHSPKYTSTKSHSGTKSIFAAPDGCSNGCATNHYGAGSLFYDAGTNPTVLYVTYWSLLDTTGAIPSFQWKQWRWRPDAMLGDRLDEYMSSDWYNSNGLNTQGYVCTMNDAVSCGNGTPAGQGYWFAGNGSQSPIIGTWFRKEIYWKYGKTNGDFVQRIFRNPGIEGVVTAKDWTGIATNPASNTKRYFVFQNYVGDSTPDSQDKGNINIYIDDVFIQTGTQARVELCDSSTWNNRKHCEIQYPTYWSDGSISINFNKGSFNVNDKVYFYVVDGNGNVSNPSGALTVLASSANSSSNDTTPPAPPQRMRVGN